MRAWRRIAAALEWRTLVRSPMFWILAAVALAHAVGIEWGLPASDGWDNDGVAPRDFFPGLAATFTPGSFYTYPPIHLAILAVLTLPITIVAVLHAPSTALPDLVRELIHVPYMTAIAYVARAVSLAMSLGIVLALARTAEELRAHALGAPADDPRVRRAGWCTAAFAGTNATLAYYAHTSNLDVPYLFWATAALLYLTRAVARNEPRLVRRAIVLAAIAVGTKDQAYALFVLAAPFAIAAWLAGAPAAERRQIVRETAIGAVLAAALLLFVDGALVNPRGFAARVAFLRGPASQDYVEYTNDWRGRLDVLSDFVARSRTQYPPALFAAIALGLGWTLATFRRGRALALLPLAAAVSFTVAFNWVARRADARFFLPQALVLTVYGGLGLEALVFPAGRAARIAGRVVAAAALTGGLFTCVAVDANLLFDPRYDAERWLTENVRPGDMIETYGNNVYMPRMPAAAHVVRVGPEPLAQRNPLPDVAEVQAPIELAEARGARFIVLSTAWVWRYQIGDRALAAGRQLAPTQQRTSDDAPAVEFFQRLVRSEGAYELRHESRYDEHLFPTVDIHGTTGRWIWIFERRP